MNSELKFVIEGLNPKLLGVDRLSIDSFKKLGVGEGNLNYIFKIKDRKFVCRVNIDKGMPNKSRDEFDSLKKVESLNIAPKPYYYHQKDKKFPHEFIIIGFIEGKPFRMKKRNYTQKQIKQLAFILSELHSKKCKGLPKKKYSFQHYLKDGEDFIKFINKHNNKLKEEFKDLHNRIGNSLPKKEEHRFSLIHDDVCPQNIVETKEGLELIDWESLQYSDPARDIAHILVDLELKNKDLRMFLQEYHKVRKDQTILERAKTYAILLRYINFLWEITRVFEIINKELPEAYLNKTTAQAHINEAKLQFRHLSRLIKIPKIDIAVLFTNAKN